MSKHWTERMFVEKPSFFGTILEKAIERAATEVSGLEEIFSEQGVPAQSLVLDLCCGMGRHSVILGERGFRVVGVDLSPSYIARAKEMAVQRKVDRRVEFRVGDMRQIGELLKNYEQDFDVVVNLYTSIGYYDEEEDRGVLRQVSELTASEGILVIETKNRDSLIGHFRHRDIEYIVDDLILIQERKLNLENSRMHSVWKYYERQQRDLKFLDAFEVNHRLYSLHELKRLVEDSGWTYQTCYGGLNLDPLTMDSNRIALVAKKT